MDIASSQPLQVSNLDLKRLHNKHASLSHESTYSVNILCCSSLDSHQVCCRAGPATEGLTHDTTVLPHESLGPALLQSGGNASKSLRDDEKGPRWTGLGTRMPLSVTNSLS